MNPRFEAVAVTDALDIGLTGYRDRATLRILDRAEAATPRQLATLVYGHRRIAQRRLRRLWQAGLLERTIVPRSQRGGSEYAYRLSDRARRQLGERSGRPRGASRLGHTLDAVEVICALVAANGDPRTSSPVRLWLDEPNAAAVLGTPPHPDGVVVLEDAGRAAVVCLEIDEATQRRGAIEAKLAAYGRLFAEHPTWWLLFVVPTRARAGWLCLAAEGITADMRGRVRITTPAAIREHGLDAPTLAADGRASGPLRGLGRVAPRPGQSGSVGSEAWLRLLGHGGIEGKFDGDL